MVNNQNILGTNRREYNILKRNYLKQSESERRQNQISSHVLTKTQQTIITQAFKIIIRDN